MVAEIEKVCAKRGKSWLKSTCEISRRLRQRRRNQYYRALLRNTRTKDVRAIAGQLIRYQRQRHYAAGSWLYRHPNSIRAYYNPHPRVENDSNEHSGVIVIPVVIIAAVRFCRKRRLVPSSVIRRTQRCILTVRYRTEYPLSNQFKSPRT